MFGEPFVLVGDGWAFIVVGFWCDKIEPGLVVVALQVRCEDCGHQPVFLGVEGADFTFAYNNYFDDDGLNSASAQAAGDFFPEQR